MGKIVICGGCQRRVEIMEGNIFPNHDVSETTLELCKQSGKEYVPGPNDWGYKYEPTYQRDPYNPEKPIPR